MQHKEYISFIIAETDVDKQEILIAELSDVGFDGFEQTEINFTANALAGNIDILASHTYLTSKGVSFKVENVPEENWNAKWEASFEPIIVEHFCAVRAIFHQPVPEVLYDIIITPKMSFGTGHHATTYMMLQMMQTVDFAGKSVIDFGTGTGILAILAEKMGARNIDAIDYDDWCIENGKENIEANNCIHINLVQAFSVENLPPVDIILANINKHVILASFENIRQSLKANGKLLVSGILETDKQDIVAAAMHIGLQKQRIIEKSGWLCICFGLS